MLNEGHNQRGDIKVGTVRGEIRFNNVDFSYTGTEAVLNDFSMVILRWANAGAGGAYWRGQIEYSKLIARFYEFQDGQITVDGHDIRNLNLPNISQPPGDGHAKPLPVRWLRDGEHSATARLTPATKK